jgi:hypothetical protein
MSMKEWMASTSLQQLAESQEQVKREVIGAEVN